MMTRMVITVMTMTRMVMLMIRKDQHGKKNIGSMISPASLVASGSDWNKFFGFFSRLEFFGEDVHWLEILCIPYTMGGSQLSFLFCPSFSAELQWFSNFAGGEMLTTGNHEMSQMPTGRFSMSRMSGRLSTLISQIHQSSLTFCSSAGDFSWTFSNTSSWCLISDMDDIFPLRICHRTLSVNYRISPLISPTGTKVAISPHEFAFWGKASRLRDHFWQLVIEFRPWHFNCEHCEKCECLNPAAFFF